MPLLKILKNFFLQGWKCIYLALKWDQKHDNNFLFGRDIINLLQSNMEKRNIATFFGWRAQDTWPGMFNLDLNFGLQFTKGQERQDAVVYKYRDNNNHI